MTRYVIGPDVAVRLAREDAVIRGEDQLLAPALLRSQVLSLLYQAVRRGEMTRKEAERQLEYVRGLRMRLLGDRVLQNVAWKAAGLLGWADTFDAEYVALTPAPRRRVDHARPATRPRREGPGDGRTHRGAVLTGANHADARPRERICRNEGVEQSEINAAHCSLCVSYDSTALGGTSVQRCREPSEEVRRSSNT